MTAQADFRNSAKVAGELATESGRCTLKHP